MVEKKIKSIDQATIEMIEKAASEGVSTIFARAEAMKPCPIGNEGSCCSQCAMGPCRVPLPRGKEETPEEKKKRRGVCGATAETIAARNFLRKIAAGSASHGDHGREVAKIFLEVAKGEAPGFPQEENGSLPGMPKMRRNILSVTLMRAIRELTWIGLFWRVIHILSWKGCS